MTYIFKSRTTQREMHFIERDRQTDRDKDRHRQTDRQTKTETERQRRSESERETEGEEYSMDNTSFADSHSNAQDY